MESNVIDRGLPYVDEIPKTVVFVQEGSVLNPGDLPSHYVLIALAVGAPQPLVVRDVY